MQEKLLTDRQIIFLVSVLWFVINLFFLQSYPFVHTDEAWLSGLTRSMMEAGSLSATEDFFDLYPRHPHALKVVYHLLQMVLISLLGYGLFSIRLLSLIAGAFSIILFHKLLQNIYKKGNPTDHLLITLIMAVDVQFLYSSHMARQESLLFLIEIAVLVLLTEKGISPTKRGLSAGLLIGAAVGIHPNAFIIAWPAGLFLIISITGKEKPLKEGFFFLIGAAIPALFFVVLSFRFNPDFLADYKSYGAPLGVLDSPDIKWLKLPGFYRKLFSQIGGTYHTPPIYLQVILFPLLLFIDCLRNRKVINLAGFTGFNIGLVIIGKYSQPSIVFLLPFYYLSMAGTFISFKKRKRKIIPELAVFGLLTITIFFSLYDISREKESFSSFIEKARTCIPEDAVLLSNLYGEFLIGSDGQFYDWRNLSLLKERGLTLENYLTDRSVEYIILTDELDFIFKNRPVWNVLYGNLANWYPQMKDLIKEKGQLLEEFPSPGYAMRIAPYRYRKEWKVRIYKINQSGSIRE